MSTTLSAGAGSGSASSRTPGSVTSHAAALTPIVIDAGSAYIKAGWAGEDSPRCCIPSIAINLTNQPPNEALRKRFDESIPWLFGYDAVEAINLTAEASGAPTLTASRPVERSLIVDVPVFIEIVKYVVEQELHIKDPHPIVLALSPFTPMSTRKELVRALFDTLQVPSVTLFNSSGLALFSAGQTTGIVLDMGEGLTSVTPVFEGKMLRHAAQALDLGGADVTQAVLATFTKDLERAIHFHSQTSSGSDASASTSFFHRTVSTPATSIVALARAVKEATTVVHPTKLDIHVVEVDHEQKASNSSDNLEHLPKPNIDPTLAGDSISDIIEVEVSPKIAETAIELSEKQRVVATPKERVLAAEILFQPQLMRVMVPQTAMLQLHSPSSLMVVPFDTYAALPRGQPTSLLNIRLGTPQTPMSHMGLSSGIQTPSSAGSGSFIFPPTPAAGMGYARTPGGASTMDLIAPSPAHSMSGRTSYYPHHSSAANPINSALSNLQAAYEATLARTPLPAPLADLKPTVTSVILAAVQGGKDGAITSHQGAVAAAMASSTGSLIPRRGIIEMIVAALQSCDEHLQKSLLNRVLIAGGGSLLPGLSSRLLNELEPLAQARGCRVEIIADSQRKFATWVGASMCATLPTFDLLKINPTEFTNDESVIHTKFF